MILLAEVPLSGRSRKPDRQAAARLIAAAPDEAVPEISVVTTAVRGPGTGGSTWSAIR